MRNTVISRRLVNKIRKLNVIRKQRLVGRACRRLVLESMEARQMLASDLMQDGDSASFCSAMESVAIAQATELSIDQDAHQIAAQTAGVSLDASMMEIESEVVLAEVYGPKSLEQEGSGIEKLSSGASAIGIPAAVVSTSVFHDYSMFAIGGIDEAIDTGKVLAQEGTEPTTLTFNNVLNNELGITGLRFVITNLPADQLSDSDFLFQLSPTGLFDQFQNPPAQWESGPVPESIEVSDVDLEDNRTVAIRWGRDSIQNRWLRITIVANENTGLSEPVVYYIGHLLGEAYQPSDDKHGGDVQTALEVNMEDLKSIRAQAGTLALPSNIWDINKDGIVSFQDIYESRRSLGNQLPLISVPGPLIAEVSLSSDSATLLDESKLGTQDTRDDSQESVVRLIDEPATVVGAYVYHRNSGLDGSGMEGALDNTTQLAMETAELTTLGVQNLINTSRGINGLVFDLMNMPAQALSLSDFQFQMSPSGAFNELTNPAINWEIAPKPEQISVVRDELSGVSRVSIHWADNAIMNRWLRVTILANSNTGLAAPVVYYLGHLQGKSTDWIINFGGLNPSGVYEVHTVDMLAIREQVGQNVGAGNVYDVNKDGVISFADISAMRNAVGVQLSNISVVSVVAAPPERISAGSDESSSILVNLSDDSSNQEVDRETSIDDGRSADEDSPKADTTVSLQTDSAATVVGAHVYYRNSNLAASGMDGGIDTNKQLARETAEPTTLNIHNVINSDRGINGLVFDLSKLPGDSLSASDFVFQVSPLGAFDELSNPAGLWELAVSPEMISVSKDQGTGVSRVSMGWQDNSIMNRWLRVTILANSNTGLDTPATYYIGHLHGKSTPWLINIGSTAPSGVFEVDNVDMFAIREQVGVNVGAENLYDVNKDGVVSFADITAMRNAVGTRLSNLTIASLAATAAPLFVSVIDSSDQDSDRELVELDDSKVGEAVDSPNGLDSDAVADDLGDSGHIGEEHVTTDSPELNSPQMVDSTLLSLVEELDVVTMLS